MKRYVSPASLVEPVTSAAWLSTRTTSAAAGRTKSAVMSRAASAAGVGHPPAPQNSAGLGSSVDGMALVLDADKFAALETRKRVAKLHTELGDYNIAM